VELWCAGHSHKEIGQQLSQAPKTIRNRLAQLRKEFGPQIVPLRHGRDNLGTSGWRQRDLRRGRVNAFRENTDTQAGTVRPRTERGSSLRIET
jgi:hypothetical protein